MDERQARALHIAATTRLAARGDGNWKVPSQKGTGTYLVAITGDDWRCNCPDWEERRQPCKHILAVQITARREGDARPTTTDEWSPVDKPTYSQNWTAYNAAQRGEKAMFVDLLADLRTHVESPAQEGRGQRRLPLADMIFAIVYRAYVGLSSRRFHSDVERLHADGYLTSTPNFTSVLRYTANSTVGPILRDLISQSALPLSAVESQFAVDSSGFGTSNRVSWFSEKHGKTIESRVWRKAHVICGTATHIVTAVEVTPSNTADGPMLPELAKRTAKGFNVEEVSADKAYLSHSNTDEIEGLGATPYIPFKVNSVEPPPGSAWARMYHLYAYRSEEFAEHYHRRSNVETTFSMIKRKFGDGLRGKTETAQDNEVLAKVLAHNLCVLIQSFHELGIEPDLAKKAA